MNICVDIYMVLEGKTSYSIHLCLQQAVYASTSNMLLQVARPSREAAQSYSWNVTPWRSIEWILHLHFLFLYCKPQQYTREHTFL